MIVHGKISTGYPKGWKIDLLDKLSRRRTGHTPDKKHPEYYDDSIPWISLADSNVLDNIYIDKTKFRISQLGLDNSSAVLLDEGTVVLSRDAGVGKSAIISQKMAVSQHFVTWTCSDLLNNYYLYCCLQEAKPLFERMAVGSTIKTIGLPFFRKLKIGYPPLPTQNRIAAILQTWDRAIQLAEQQLEDLQTRKRGLMQLLLTGKKRLPEFEGLGEWEEVRIGDLLKEVKRPLKWDDNELYHLVSIRRRSGGLFDRESLYGRQIMTKTLKAIATDDFVISKMQIVHGASALVSAEFDGKMASGSYLTLRIKDPKKHSVAFLDYLSRLPKFYHQTYISSYGVHIEKMTFDFTSWKNQKLSFPSLKEQEKVVAILKSEESGINTGQVNLNSLRLQKSGLMQRLLEGEVEVGEEMDKILEL